MAVYRHRGTFEGDGTRDVVVGQLKIDDQATASCEIRWDGHRFTVPCKIEAGRLHGAGRVQTVPYAGSAAYVASVSIDVAIDLDQDGGSLDGRWVCNGWTCQWTADLEANAPTGGA